MNDCNDEGSEFAGNKSVRSTLSDSDLVTNATIDSGSAVVGALVGLSVGGPAGAVLGAVASPLASAATRFAVRSYNRRVKRVETVLKNAIDSSEISRVDIEEKLNRDEQLVDDIVLILTQIHTFDLGFDEIIQSILSEIIVSESEQNRDRMLILADTIRGLRRAHVQIIKGMAQNNNVMNADEMSDLVGLSVVELRSVVRGLELRGILKDLGGEPVAWELRELGQAIASFSSSN